MDTFFDHSKNGLFYIQNVSAKPTRERKGGRERDGREEREHGIVKVKAQNQETVSSSPTLETKSVG